MCCEITVTVSSLLLQTAVYMPSAIAIAANNQYLDQYGQRGRTLAHPKTTQAAIKIYDMIITDSNDDDIAITLWCMVDSQPWSLYSHRCCRPTYNTCESTICDKPLLQ